MTAANPAPEVATTPAVVQDAQQVESAILDVLTIGWLRDGDGEKMERVCALIRQQAAHIELLEAERDALRLRVDELLHVVDTLLHAPRG